MTSLRQRYSFTQLKKVDWNELESTYREAAQTAQTPRDFAKAIQPMLSTLNDLHVWIELPAGDRVYTHRSRYRPNDNPTYLRTQFRELKEFSAIGWIGMTAEKIGFIRVTALPNTQDFDDFVAAINEMGPVRGWIVDLRRNQGGSESQAAKIAGLFAAQRTKYARSLWCSESGELAEGPPRFLAPASSQHRDQPVVCLIGPGCVSSGEGFALMMKALDHVQVIGQPTRGASGNPHAVTLANGVRVWFSRWVSLELDGRPIEGQGVRPHRLVKHSDEGDVTFDRAIQLLKDPFDQ